MTYEEAKQAVEKAEEAIKNLPKNASFWDKEMAKRNLYTAQIRAKQLKEDEDGGDGNGGGSSGARPRHKTQITH